MNGKAARLLRKMRRGAKADKRVWYQLTPNERGAISWAGSVNTKLMRIDYLPNRGYSRDS